MCFERQAVQRQHDQGVAFARFHLGLRVGCAPAQHPQGQAVQVFQELALPGIPDLGAGAANVRHRQQVQRGQTPLAADPLGKGGNHVSVAQVRLLCDPAHGQVLVHQELDQTAVVPPDVVLAAKPPHLLRAQL